MKRARRKLKGFGNSVLGSSGETQDMVEESFSKCTENRAEKSVAKNIPETPDTEINTYGESTRGLEAKKSSRRQLAKHKGVRNDPRPSTETLVNRHKYDEGLRRGLLQAARSNEPLPEWLLRRKSYDRAGEFYVRLKAELVAPEERDQAKITRLLAELPSSQQQGTNYYDDTNEAIPRHGIDQVEVADTEVIDEELLAREVKGDREVFEPSTELQSYAGTHYKALRRGLLKAAHNGTVLSDWLKLRNPSSLGDFWVRLKAELMATDRDQAKIKRMLDEFRASDQRNADATRDKLTLAEAIADANEKDEDDSEQEGYPGMDEAEAKVQGQPDMDIDEDEDDDVFVRRPKRRQHPLAR